MIKPEVTMDYKFHCSARRYTLIAFLYLVMIACAKDATAPLNGISGSFESLIVASAQDRIVYMPKGDKLFIDVIAIEDSRCPSDAACIWAGAAQVKFSIVETGQVIVLYATAESTSEHPSAATFLFSGRVYKITLSDVTPYPTMENSESNQKAAHFSVHRAD